MSWREYERSEGWGLWSLNNDEVDGNSARGLREVRKIGYRIMKLIE